MTLKEKLLTLGIVEDNDYLDKYIELVESNKTTKKEKFKTQTHHIIPRGYYKHLNINVNNKKENLVNLKYHDHVLAHYYLAKCAVAPWFFYSCTCALNKMYNDFKIKDDVICINEVEFIESIEKIDHFIEQSFRVRADIIKDCIWMNNGHVDSFVPKKLISSYLEAGWVKGRIYKVTEETKEKLRQASLGKHHEVSEEAKRKIGEANKISLKGKKLSKERVEKIRERNSNCKWYNNGIENKFIPKDQLPPKGFIPGMILTNTTKEEWMSKVHAGRKSEDYNTTGGTIVINNGKVNKHIKEEELNSYLEKDWFRGKLPLGKLNWYNNGIKNTRASSCPDGYVEGRLLTEEVRKSLGNGSRNRKSKNQ